MLKIVEAASLQARLGSVGETMAQRHEFCSPDPSRSRTSSGRSSDLAQADRSQPRIPAPTLPHFIVWRTSARRGLSLPTSSDNDIPPTLHNALLSVEPFDAASGMVELPMRRCRRSSCARRRYRADLVSFVVRRLNQS
jgi:hypothetical protein